MKKVFLSFSYFELVAKESDLVCFGCEETIYCLESGAVETLLCWEGLEATRYTLRLGRRPDDVTVKFAVNEKQVNHKTKVSLKCTAV